MPGRERRAGRGRAVQPNRRVPILGTMPLILRLPVAAGEAGSVNSTPCAAPPSGSTSWQEGGCSARARALQPGRCGGGNRSNADWADFLGSVMRFHEGLGLPEGWPPADFFSRRFGARGTEGAAARSSGARPSGTG